MGARCKNVNCVAPRKTLNDILDVYMLCTKVKGATVLKTGHDDADNDIDIDFIAFGDEPTFVEGFGTFTANLLIRIISSHFLESRLIVSFL